MSFLSIASSIAIVLGLTGTVPQIVAMLRRRSAAGQSPVGWGIGIVVHALMGYVNYFGYGATTLAVGSGFSLTLAAVALTCTLRLPREPAAAIPEPEELPTGDLAEMLQALAEERERREARRRAQAEAHEARRRAGQPEGPQPCEGRERRRSERQPEHHPLPQPTAA